MLATINEATNLTLKILNAIICNVFVDATLHFIRFLWHIRQQQIIKALKNNKNNNKQTNKILPHLIACFYSQQTFL